MEKKNIQIISVSSSLTQSTNDPGAMLFFIHFFTLFPVRRKCEAVNARGPFHSFIFCFHLNFGPGENCFI